jgi:hypothetical protein
MVRDFIESSLQGKHHYDIVIPWCFRERSMNLVGDTRANFEAQGFPIAGIDHVEGSELAPRLGA